MYKYKAKLGNKQEKVLFNGEEWKALLLLNKSDRFIRTFLYKWQHSNNNKWLEYLNSDLKPANKRNEASGAAHPAAATGESGATLATLHNFLSALSAVAPQKTGWTECPPGRTCANTTHLLHRLFQALRKDNKDQMLLIVVLRCFPQSSSTYAALVSCPELCSHNVFIMCVTADPQYRVGLATALKQHTGSFRSILDNRDNSIVYRQKTSPIWDDWIYNNSGKPPPHLPDSSRIWKMIDMVITIQVALVYNTSFCFLFLTWTLLLLSGPSQPTHGDQLMLSIHLKKEVCLFGSQRLYSHI